MLSWLVEKSYPKLHQIFHIRDFKFQIKFHQKTFTMHFCRHGNPNETKKGRFCKRAVSANAPSFRLLSQSSSRGAPEGATTLLHFSKCSRPFVQSINSTLAHLKSCNPVGTPRQAPLDTGSVVLFLNVWYPRSGESGLWGARNWLKWGGFVSQSRY